MKTPYRLIAFASLACLLAAACGGKSDRPETTPAAGGEKAAGDARWRGYVSALELNFRTEPDAEAPPVAGREVVYWGVEADVLEEKGEWVRVRLDDGAEGWLRREYQGNTYVDRVDKKDVFTVDGPPDRPTTSPEFLAWADEEARKWDGGAKLEFLCGSRGGLDGRCHEWVAFYRSPGKPGKKYLCARNVFNTKDSDRRSEEWGEDWVYVDGKKRDDDLGVAPGPTWWRYEDAAAVGRDFISSAELCSAANAETIIEKGASACGGKAAFARSVNADVGFNFYLDRGSWVVTTGSGYTGDLVFVFDASTGRFSRFGEKRFEITGG